MAANESSEKVKIISYSESSEKRYLVLDHSKVEEIVHVLNNVPVAVICVTSRENLAISELIRSCFTSTITKSPKETILNKIKLDPTVEDCEPGIWLTTSPLRVKVEGENIGLLFLEARGRPFDGGIKNEEEWSYLLGLSFLISSHVILPCSKYIQEILLTTIKNNCPNIDDYTGKSEIFQNLHFLTYDWTLTLKHTLGSKGGYDMLHSKLETHARQAETAQKIRRTIKNSFEKLRCFLLPNSGQFFKDGVAIYDESFAQLMNQFILESFDGYLIAPKRFLNQEIFASNICFFFQKCVDSINRKAAVPLHETVFLISSDIAIHSALVMYSDQMKMTLKGKSADDFNRKEILNAHNSLKGKAIENYTSFSGATSGPEILKEKVDEEFQKLKEMAALGEKENVENDDVADFEVSSTISLEKVSFEELSSNISLEEINFEELSSNASLETVDVDEKLDLNGKTVQKNPVFQMTYNSDEDQEEIICRRVLEELDKKILKRCESDALLTFTVENANEMVIKTKTKAVECYAKETSLLGINHFHLLDEYKEKLENSIDDFYNSIKTHLQTKSENSNASDDVEELFLWVQVQIPDDFANEDEINKIFRQFSSAGVQNLTDDNKSSSSQLNDILEFNEKLNNLKSEIIAEFQSTEMGYRDAYKASVKLYEEKMSSYLKEREFLSDEYFEALNDQSLTEAEDYFEIFPYPKVSQYLHQKFFERIQGKLEYSAKEFSLKNKERKRKVLESISSRKALCLAQYNVKLKNASEATFDDHSLQLLHEKAKNDVSEEFQSYNSTRDPKLWMKTFEELYQDIQTSYGSIQDSCRLKWSQQTQLSKVPMIKASGLYNGYMRACLFEMRFIDPPELQNLHQNALAASLKKCTEIFRSPPLTENYIKNISLALTIEFELYKSRNLMNLPNDPAIGIDLGTTYSSVAVFNKEKGVVEVLTNRSSGSKVTPSYVVYKNGVATVGEAAKEQASDNPENTIFDAKRFIGRRFDDKILQNDMSLWSFKVIEESGSPKMKIGGKTYFPEQISAKVLEEMKKIAEDYLGCKVEKAVISVPAYFNDGQRQATIDAGDLAGLKVLKIINEPTAAAIAFKIEHSGAGKRNILIYDLGGGTFDVAILECLNNEIDVLVVDGDTHLGGVDFDAKIVDYCCEDLRRKTGINLKEGRDSIDANKQARASRILTLLKYECEKSKKHFSKQPDGEYLIHIDSVIKGVDLNVRVTKELFDEINMDLFEKTIRIVNRALVTAKLEPSEIDDVVLIGGSTKIRKLQEMLSDNFGGKPLTFKINPIEAVAVGAAFQAAMTNGHIIKQSELYRLISDVTSFSIGVQGVNKKFSIIIPKNTKLPHKLKQDYQTAQDNQTVITLSVFQGENPLADDNMLLGKFDLNGIPRGAKGKHIIEVEIKVDTQGMLHVTARCKSTGLATTYLSVVGQKSRMTKDNILQIKTREMVMANFRN